MKASSNNVIIKEFLAKYPTSQHEKVTKYLMILGIHYLSTLNKENAQKSPPFAELKAKTKAFQKKKGPKPVVEVTDELSLIKNEILKLNKKFDERLKSSETGTSSVEVSDKVSISASVAISDSDRKPRSEQSVEHPNSHREDSCSAKSKAQHERVNQSSQVGACLSQPQHEVFASPSVKKHGLTPKITEMQPPRVFKPQSEQSAVQRRHLDDREIKDILCDPVEPIQEPVKNIMAIAKPPASTNSGKKPPLYYPKGYENLQQSKTPLAVHHHYEETSEINEYCHPTTVSQADIIPRQNRTALVEKENKSNYIENRRAASKENKDPKLNNTAAPQPSNRKHQAIRTTPRASSKERRRSSRAWAQDNSAVQGEPNSSMRQKVLNVKAITSKIREKIDEDKRRYIQVQQARQNPHKLVSQYPSEQPTPKAVGQIRRSNNPSAASLYKQSVDVQGRAPENPFRNNIQAVPSESAIIKTNRRFDSTSVQDGGNDEGQGPFETTAKFWFVQKDREGTRRIMKIDENQMPPPAHRGEPRYVWQESMEGFEPERISRIENASIAYELPEGDELGMSTRGGNMLDIVNRVLNRPWIENLESYDQQQLSRINQSQQKSGSSLLIRPLSQLLPGGALPTNPSPSRIGLDFPNNRLVDDASSHLLGSENQEEGQYSQFQGQGLLQGIDYADYFSSTGQGHQQVSLVRATNQAYGRRQNETDQSMSSNFSVLAFNEDEKGFLQNQMLLNGVIQRKSQGEMVGDQNEGGLRLANNLNTSGDNSSNLSFHEHDQDHTLGEGGRPIEAQDY